VAAVNLTNLFQRVTWSTNWVARAVLRRVGVLGAVWCGILIVILVLMVFLLVQARKISELKMPSLIVADLTTQDPSGAVVSMDSELSEFQNYLLNYADIPNALSDLIALAQANNLVLSRGEYQIALDARGKFIRYQMILPVRGEAIAVERFILEALAQHKTMALESVQFKREERSSKELEAKVQWVLLTQLPRVAGASQ
jgi:hypothetical protein